MPNNDIEKNLKDSADKISVKSFSERWNNIKDNINPTEEREILVESPVLVTNGNTVVGSGNKKRNLLIVVSSLVFCIIVTLAVVLPLTLRKNESAYLGPPDLLHSFVDSKEQFFYEIENAGIDIIDLSEYEVEEYSLLVTTNGGKVKGGKLTFSDYEKGFVCLIEFYDSSVLVENEISNGKSYVVNSTEIEYVTQFDDSVYTTDAYVRHKNVTYLIKYTSLLDNCTDIFEEFFS